MPTTQLGRSSLNRSLVRRIDDRRWVGNTVRNFVQTGYIVNMVIIVQAGCTVPNVRSCRFCPVASIKTERRENCRKLPTNAGTKDKIPGS